MLKGEEEQDADEEDERVQVAPNMGAGGSHPQATSDLVEEGVGRRKNGRPGTTRFEEKRKARKLRWADCNDEEEKENQGEHETEGDKEKEGERKK